MIALAYLHRARRRLLIWFVALLVAWFVPLHTVGFPWPIIDWVHGVEAHHKMQDSFMAVVAMVVLSGTDFFEVAFPRHGVTVTRFGRGYGRFAITIYGIFVVFGMAQFDKLDKISATDAAPYWWTMLVYLALGTIGELVIARESLDAT